MQQQSFIIQDKINDFIHINKHTDISKHSKKKSSGILKTILNGLHLTAKIMNKTDIGRKMPYLVKIYDQFIDQNDEIKMSRDVFILASLLICLIFLIIKCKISKCSKKKTI